MPSGVKLESKARSIYRLKSKAHKKPWEALEMSRATYYRLGYHRETGVRKVLTRHQTISVYGSSHYVRQV